MKSTACLVLVLALGCASGGGGPGTPAPATATTGTAVARDAGADVPPTRARFIERLVAAKMSFVMPEAFAEVAPAAWADYAISDGQVEVHYVVRPGAGWARRKELVALTEEDVCAFVGGVTEVPDAERLRLGADAGHLAVCDLKDDGRRVTFMMLLHEERGGALIVFTGDTRADSGAFMRVLPALTFAP